MDLSKDLGGRRELHASARLDSHISGCGYHSISGAFGFVTTGGHLDALRHCRRTDVDGWITNPLDGRSHRNAFPRFWVSGLSGFLSRLEGPCSSHVDRGGRSLSPRNLLATIRLRSSHHNEL